MGDGSTFAPSRAVCLTNEVFNSAKANLEKGEDITLDPYVLQGTYGTSPMTSMAAVRTAIAKLKCFFPNLQCNRVRGEGFKLSLKKDIPTSTNIKAEPKTQTATTQKETPQKAVHVLCSFCKPPTPYPPQAFEKHLLWHVKMGHIPTETKPTESQGKEGAT